eukprot:5511103-Pyramimonas_sp.AAC.1
MPDLNIGQMPLSRSSHKRLRIHLGATAFLYAFGVDVPLDSATSAFVAVHGRRKGTSVSNLHATPKAAVGPGRAG